MTSTVPPSPALRLRLPLPLRLRLRLRPPPRSVWARTVLRLCYSKIHTSPRLSAVRAPLLVAQG